MKSFHSSFEAIGTRWVIDVYDEMTPEKEAQLQAHILQRIEEFDAIYSRFRADSLVSQMARKAGTYTLPPDSTALLDLYRTVYQLTGGMFTPLIGSVLEEAGYDARYSLQPKELHAPLAWEEAFIFHNQELTMKKPSVLDFGAAGKGYLVDLISELIRNSHFNNFCVDAGGDIFYANQEAEPLRVGLEHPTQPGQVIGVASVLNQSICGSSGNRRKWDTFHHIMNPVTLTSPSSVLATWVVADTALWADALTTCLFFVPPETLIPTFHFEYAILYADFTLKTSSNFPGEVFRKETEL